MYLSEVAVLLSEVAALSSALPAVPVVGVVEADGPEAVLAEGLMMS